MSDKFFSILHETRQQMTAEGSMFALSDITIRGVKMKCYANAPPSLREIWQLAAGHADKDYLVYESERWSYNQAQAETASLANWCLQNGIKQGDRVAIAMRNYPEWTLAYWALTSVGITVVGMNAWWVADEMAYALEDSAPKALICDSERLRIFQDIADKFPKMTLIGVRLDKPSDNVIDYHNLKTTSGTLPDTNIDGDEDACIFYTSGTTGRPKGAQLTHRGCVHNAMNMAFMNLWVGTAQAHAADKPEEAPQLGQGPVPAVLLTTPLFHVTANNCVMHPATLAGGKIVHMYKWDVGEALKLVEREQLTGVSGVPTMARELIAHPDFAKYDTSSLTALGGGGAALQPDLVEKIESALPAGRAATGYGLTETCGIVSAVSQDYFVARPESVGPCVPVMEAKCIDHDGKDVPQGEPGELCVKGPNVIKGYLNRTEATAEAIQDGWFRTGDIARIDADGFIYIVDRLKDMVLRGGENVYCAEVENAIFRHESVAEAAAFGVPDERLGEEVAVAIYLAKGAKPDADAIREHCATLIAKHKVPRYIWFVPEPLPRNANGKFLKRQLREQLQHTDAA